MHLLAILHVKTANWLAAQPDVGLFLSKVSAKFCHLHPFDKIFFGKNFCQKGGGGRIGPGRWSPRRTHLATWPLAPIPNHWSLNQGNSKFHHKPKIQYRSHRVCWLLFDYLVKCQKIRLTKFERVTNEYTRKKKKKHKKETNEMLCMKSYMHFRISLFFFCIYLKSELDNQLLNYLKFAW